MTYVKSDIDNKFYLVRNAEDKHNAANMLAKINKNILDLSEYLEKNRENYPEYKEYIDLLYKKAPNIILVESTQDSLHTSYSVNKGEQIVFCLRTKKLGNELHDLNLVMYVVLHEISHVACPIYDNHGPLFKKIFAFITTEAIKLGLYKRIDFMYNPTEYCGMEINSSII
jgi:predicted metal-dependent hydrolase